MLTYTSLSFAALENEVLRLLHGIRLTQVDHTAQLNALLAAAEKRPSVTDSEDTVLEPYKELEQFLEFDRTLRDSTEMKKLVRGKSWICSDCSVVHCLSVLSQLCVILVLMATDIHQLAYISEILSDCRWRLCKSMAVSTLEMRQRGFCAHWCPTKLQQHSAGKETRKKGSSVTFSAARLYFVSSFHVA